MVFGVLPETADQIKAAEERIDSALWGLEVKGNVTEALQEYQAVAEKLESLEVKSESQNYREQQRILAYAYLRIGNALRQLGRGEEALQIGERELECARNSGNDLALARTLMNYGTTLLTGGQVEKGLIYIEKSRPLFEKGEDSDYKQGLGWYWILKAELGLAGLTEEKPQDILGYIDAALKILEPIENWTGMARAYGLRAKVNESQGLTEAAVADRKDQAKYQARVEEETEQ
jgi:tetratricopeptide (TPR) repeat protein